jgi:hypothetical protein
MPFVAVHESALARTGGDGDLRRFPLLKVDRPFSPSVPQTDVTCCGIFGFARGVVFSLEAADETAGVRHTLIVSSSTFCLHTVAATA